MAYVSSQSMSDLRDDVYGGLPDTETETDSEQRDDADDERHALYAQLLSPAGSSNGEAHTARMHTFQQRQQQHSRVDNSSGSNGHAAAAGLGARAAAAAGGTTAATTTAAAGAYDSRHEDAESVELHATMPPSPVSCAAADCLAD